ncbi:MAG: NTP pyrophosphohydrolase [halophilic archaeon J07HB67]|nr:MAG: NTP pyrophosphohydrolase [halophilic archaeon J07HB67]
MTITTDRSLPPDGPTVSTPLAVESRQRTDEQLARLRDRFGAFPTTRTTVVDDHDRFERGLDRYHAGAHGSAQVRVTDDDGRLLLLREPDRPDEWHLPGGGNEPGESLAATARREAFEEAGVEVELTGVWVASRTRYVDRSDPQRRGYLLDVVCEARQVGGEAGLYPERWDAPDDDPDEEILAVEWFTTPPSNAQGVVSDPHAWELDRRR